jgi:hypothetical protein
MSSAREPKKGRQLGNLVPLNDYFSSYDAKSALTVRNFRGKVVSGLMTNSRPQTARDALHCTGASLSDIAKYCAFAIHYNATVGMLMEKEPWHQG